MPNSLLASICRILAMFGVCIVVLWITSYWLTLPVLVIPRQGGWDPIISEDGCFTLAPWGADYLIGLVPHWFVAIALLLPLIVRRLVLLFIRRPRRDPTLCPTCSYDLRAHTAGGKCPECGTLITRAAQVNA